MADGSNAFMRAGCISMVPAVAATVYALGFDAANLDLDSEHHTNVLRLVFARAWPAMAGPRLDHAAGIWVCSTRCCYHRFAPDRTTGRSEILTGSGRVKATAPNRNSCIHGPLCVIQHDI